MNATIEQTATKTETETRYYVRFTTDDFLHDERFYDGVTIWCYVAERDGKESVDTAAGSMSATEAASVINYLARVHSKVGHHVKTTTEELPTYLVKYGALLEGETVGFNNFIRDDGYGLPFVLCGYYNTSGCKDVTERRGAEKLLAHVANEVGITIGSETVDQIVTNLRDNGFCVGRCATKVQIEKQRRKEEQEHHCRVEARELADAEYKAKVDAVVAKCVDWIDSFPELESITMGGVAIHRGSDGVWYAAHQMLNQPPASEIPFLSEGRS